MTAHPFTGVSMERLERLGLFGEGLVPVATPALVGRYNETLADLGIAPTELSEFHVDGMGWSPEIAVERGKRYYLSHGMAHPLAIVVSPDQRNKPVYAPFASYDRRLMKAYFDRFLPEIADVTRDAALWLDFDRHLSRFTSPRDLLLVDYVTIRSNAGRLTQAAREQRGLVERFQNEELGWFDAALRSRIVESATVHGDLRFRRLDIPELRFDEVGTFYTGLFGGTFVLRSLKHAEHLLILQDEEEMKKLAEPGENAWLLADGNLVVRLMEEDVVGLDMDWYRRDLGVLREKLGYISGDAICRADPEVDFAELTLPQQRQRIEALGDAVPETYFELERLIVQLERGTVDAGDVSPELRLLLLHPHDRFAPGSSERDVIWQLLCRLSDLDILRLYVVDKEAFFEAYRSWPESKKRWAAGRIAGTYRARMDTWENGGST